jgi:hypothetical protein
MSTPANSSFNYDAGNVYPNNVIPIFPWLYKTDAQLTGTPCDLTTPEYTNRDISQANNYLATDSGTDWLYMAANLRGNAKENVHVLYRMSPQSAFEGASLVFAGARFVYWNPANGPNSFLGE